MKNSVNLGEGCPGEEEREDVGRVEADEAAGVGPGLGLRPGEREAEAEETRGQQEGKLSSGGHLHNEELHNRNADSITVQIGNHRHK